MINFVTMNFLKITKLFALCAVCVLAMAACSDKKEEVQKEPVEQDPYIGLQALKSVFFVYPTEELREVADVTCTITDYYGKSKTYKLNKDNVVEVNLVAEQPEDPNLWGGMTRAGWINLPVTATAVVEVKLKDGFTPDPERDYNFSIQIDGMMTAYNNFGNVISEKTAPLTMEKSFPAGEGLIEWVEGTFPFDLGFKCEFVNNTFKVSQLN